MKANTIFHYTTIVVGILVTFFMLAAYGPKLLDEFNVNGLGYFVEIAYSFLDWYDNPTAFFFTYFFGYIIVWKKPILGSVIIVLGDILFFGFNPNNMGTFIFIVPTCTVALLYTIDRYVLKSNC